MANSMARVAEVERLPVATTMPNHPEAMCVRLRPKRRRRRTPEPAPSGIVGPALVLLAAVARRGPLLPAARAECNPCGHLSTGYIQIPGSECTEFAQCEGGAIAQRFQCQAGLIYDASLQQCNWAFSATCGPDVTCPPTASPSDGPTESPSLPPILPTAVPTAESTFEATDQPAAGPPRGSSGGRGETPVGRNPVAGTAPMGSPALPPSAGGPSGKRPLRREHHAAVWAHLNANKIPISNQLLRSARRMLRNLHGKNVNADELRNYAYYDFYGALRSMAEEGYAVPVPTEEGGTQVLAYTRNGGLGDEGAEIPPQQLSRELFYLGEPGYENAAAVGLVNVAAFLSQAMADSVSSGSCDELNEDLVDGSLPSSNACGQFGLSYQDMHCTEEERFMECEPYPDMRAQAHRNGRPEVPMFCGGTEVYPFTGTADFVAGRAPMDGPAPNRLGRTDVEGCCWWGRGTLHTRGVCQYGKLNYYLGARAAQEGRPARFPHIDFCEHPQSVCSASPHDSSIEWISGLFRWVDGVQSYRTYNDDGSVGWNYIQELHNFVAGGMRDGLFIRSVSSIVTQGCHDAPCPGTEGTGVELVDANERWSYFLQVLEALGLPVTALRQE